MKGSPFSALTALVAVIGLAALVVVLPGYLSAQQQVTRLKQENLVLATTLAARESELAAALSQRDAALAEVDSLWRAVIAEQSAKTHFRNQLAVAQAALADRQNEVARLSGELAAAQAALASLEGSDPAGSPTQTAGLAVEPSAAIGTLAATLLVVAGAGAAIHRREAEAAW